MRLSSFRALSAAAAAVALAAPAPALAQREIPGANGLWTMLQREMEKSTDMLQQLWGSAFGNHGQTTVVVLTVDEQEDDELTDEEKAFACRVAVERVDEQAALTREAQRMTSRLRTPLGKLVTFHFEGETSCDDLASPALVRECARVASMDTEIAAFLRRGKTHDEICDVVHMMDELANDPPPLSCKLCKRFVKMVDDAIKQDMAQVQQVREILGDICDSMSVDSMCHTFLKHYDDVVQWLVHGTDPQVVCERLTMCAPVEGDETALTVAVDRVSHACFYCEHISGAVAFVLQHAPGQLETLHTIVKFACKLAPKDCKCGDISTNYGKIVDWTKQGKTPEEICIALGMCKKEEAATMAVATVSDDKHGCFYCEHIAGAVQFVVQHAPDQLDALRKAIKVVCKLAPKDCKCEDMATNFDKIVDWVKQGKTPEDICVALGMCKKETSDNETRLAVLPTVSDDNHACFYCEHISGAVAFVIQHAPDQLSILRKAIKVVCKLAPKDCKCDDYSANFDNIVDWTKQGKTPEEICVSIGMCKKTESSTKMLGLVMNPKFAETLSSLLMLAGRDDKKCFYCEYFTTLLEIAIQEDEQSMDQIRQYADLICGILGDNKYCHEYVSKLDTAIDDIKKGEKPHEICADMLFCTKTEEAARLAVVTRSDDKQCFYCDYFVTLLEIVMQQDDADVEQIQQYADLVCGMLGDDNICHKYMDKFDAAIDALKQGKKPREICTEFKFCTKFQTLALPPPTIVDGDNECFYCDYFVTILEIVIQEDKADIDQVREFADMICGMLGDDNVCHQYVDKFDKAVDELRQGKKPREICVDLKFCANKAIAVKRPVVSEKKCLYCDYFVTILEVFIVQDDTDINMVRQYADMICGMLGDDNVCHQYVDKFDVIVDDLKSGKKPHDICVDVKFCTKSQVLALPVPLAPQDNKTCFYCDYITTILEVALQEDPNDVGGIRLYAEIVCGMLGDGSVCHKYLDQLKYAIDALKKGKKPREICAEFKYCGSSQLSHSAPVVINTAAVLKDAMVKHVVPRAVSGVDECFFCTQVASLMKVAVAQDPTKVAEIRTVADLICKTLPAENKCHAVIREMDQIIDSIKQGEEPAAICQDMKFCKKTEANFPVPKQVAAVKDNTCAYCDGVATVLEYALKSKPDQVQQLREAAGIVCDFIPQDDKCHDDLKQFDKAVESLKAGKSPHEVCVDANLCHDKAMPTTSSKLLPSSIAKLNLLDSKTLASKTAESEKSMSMGCLLCEYTAEALVIIKGDASELRLAKQALETMCIVLPPSARCDVLSSKFDELVELVGKGKSPSQACNAISLCDAAFVEPMGSPSEPKRIGAVVAEQ